ncbi:MAG: transglutaminase domain-containing protein [bacterium]|nr:transglutaminase domain-containing protein [bacterium]
MSRLSERRNMALTLDAMPRQRRYLFMFSFASAFVALQMLYLALDDMSLNLWLVSALGAGFTYSYFLEQRHRVFTEYWVSIFATGVSINYYIKIQGQQEYLGNFLGIMAGVLIVLLAFKAFAPADHRFILLLETVVLIFSAVASFDLKFMLLLPLFLVAAGSSLYVASQIEILAKVADSTRRGEPLQTITIGRTFYKVLWRAVGGLILLSIIAYTVTPHAARGDRSLIFNSAPNVDTSGRRGQLDGSQTEIEQIDSDEINVGIGNEFDLTSNAELSANPRPVVAVKCHRNGYLRAQIYDYYIGSGWVRSTSMSTLHELSTSSNFSAFGSGSDTFAQPTSFKVTLFDFPSEVAAQRLSGDEQDFKVTDKNIFSIDDKLDLQYERIRQEVRLLDNQPSHYFAMYQPAQLLNISVTQGSGARVDEPRVDRAGTVRPNGMAPDDEHPEHFSYTVVSLEPRYSTRQLEQVAFFGPEEIVAHYTQLPDSAEPPKVDKEKPNEVKKENWRAITPRLRNLADAIVLKTKKDGGKPLTPYQKVTAIYDYLTDSGEFKYTREHRSVENSKEQTEEFCLRTQEGYCRQFASAMAVLCRLNGVPSRVVSGFAPGSYSLIENAYIYQASDAHAWVEVYFDGYGWIMFDPSPSSSDLFNKNDLIRNLTGITDFFSQLFVLDPAATQKMILESLRSFWQTIISYGPAAMLFIVVSLLLLGLGFFIARMPRHGRRTRFHPDNAVVSSYISVCDSLALIGLKQDSGQTARSYLSQASVVEEPLRPALLQLMPLYEQAAFAHGDPQGSAEENARGILKQVQEYVRAELARRKRQRRSPG